MSFNSSLELLNRPLENFEGNSENSNNSSDNIKLGEMNGRSIQQISSTIAKDDRQPDLVDVTFVLGELGYALGQLGYLKAKDALSDGINQILNSSCISLQNNKPKQD